MLMFRTLVFNLSIKKKNNWIQFIFKVIFLEAEDVGFLKFAASPYTYFSPFSRVKK